MKRLPEVLRTAYQRIFQEKAVPQAERMDYLKWFRYYLDFCQKYKHPPRDPDSLEPFLEKLASKNQSIGRQKEATA